MDMSQHDPLDFIASCLDMNDYASALDVINSLHEEDLSAEDRGRLAALEYLCYHIAENDAAADKIVERLTGYAESDPAIAYAAATQLVEMETLDEAEELMRNICQHHSDRADYHYELASLLEDLEQYEEAAGFYQRAAELNPDLAEAWLGYGDCLSEIDLLEEAADAYARFLALRPNDQQVLIDYGSLLGDLKRYDEAEAAFERAEKLGGEELDLYFYWAAVASAKDDREQLDRCQERLTQQAPESWQAKLVDAFVAEKDEEIWPAWESCREAFEIAWEEDDEGGLETSAETAIHFAMEHGMTDTLEDFLPLIYEARVFSMPVLAALRHAFGTPSEQAADFEVSVEGEAAEEEVDEALGGVIENGPPYRFFRSYRVLANDAEQAESFVRDFEERCGAGELIVHSVQRLPWQGAADLGVWNRSEAHYFSAYDESGI